MGVGIPSMRDRLLEIGGRLEIDSSPCGTTVLIRNLFKHPTVAYAA